MNPQQTKNSATPEMFPSVKTNVSKAPPIPELKTSWWLSSVRFKYKLSYRSCDLL